MLVPVAISSSDFELLKRLLRDASGIVLTERDLARVEARLAPVARANGLGSVELLLSRMRGASAELQLQAVDALAAPVTAFLLDGRVGAILCERILPQLIARRQSVRRLRFWCPAAGSGQEPYSIALALRERFPELDGWDITILASERTPAALERLAAASYSPIEVADGLPMQTLLRRFVREGVRWRLKDDIRSLVRIGAIDLRGAWPELEPFDAIMMRHVLTYLAPTSRAELLARVRASLRPDGYLFLGSTDADVILDQRFERMQDEKSGFYRPVG